MNGSTSPKGDAPWISQASICEAYIYVFLLKLKKSYISNSIFSDTFCSDIQVQYKCGLYMGHGPVTALQTPVSIL